MSKTIFSRSARVVWRLGPDRVLVRRVDGADGEARELFGAAALVWISLDLPGARSDIVARAVDAGLMTEIEEALKLLLDEKLIVATSVE